MRAKNIIILLLLLVMLFTGGRPVLPVNSGGDALSAEELRQLTTQLTREFFEVNWQLAAAEKEKQALMLEIDQLEKQRRTAAQSLTAVTGDAQKKRQRLSRWLKFIYQHGQLSFVNLFFEAETLVDFLTAKHLTAIILSYQSKLLDDVLLNQSLLKEQQDLLRKSRQEKEDKLNRIQLLEAKLLSLAGEKQAALEAARRVEKEYGLEILARERRWKQMVSSLDGILSAFKNLQWGKLEPRNLKINLFQGAATAEFTQENLQQIIRESAQGVNFDLQIDQDGLKLGREDGNEMVLQASVEVYENRLRLKPDSLTMEGEALSPELVEQLMSGRDLTAPLPEVYPGVTAKKVQPRAGYLQVQFGWSANPVNN